MQFQPATDLRSAYRASDVKPLEGDDLDHYYMQLGDARKSQAMSNIKSKLDSQEVGEFGTIWFTGHQGSGKSTELRKLERTWQNEYYVIYIKTEEVIDINDVEYTDLYLLAAQYLEDKLRKEKISLDSRIVKDFEDWFKEITKETETSIDKGFSIQAEANVGIDLPMPFLGKILAKITSQIRGGSKEKTVIRQILEKDFSRLNTTINLLLDDGTKKLIKKFPQYKGILLIFDNLDRCPLEVAKHLFSSYIAQLKELRCTIIYTVPISALYLSRGIDNPYIVSMVNIYEYDKNRDPVTFNDLKHNDLSLKALVSLVKLRMDIDKVFASEAVLLDIIRASGGHVRHLMQMLREASITAISRNHQTIDLDDATYAINQLQFSFERRIPHDHYDAIAKTYYEKRIDNNEIGQETLLNTSVLEYNGDQRWNFPHPMVIATNAFQQSLAKLKQSI